ncbi:MAG: hypothetical protein AB1394_14655, partial [Bacteroidota bacterium]
AVVSKAQTSNSGQLLDELLAYTYSQQGGLSKEEEEKLLKTLSPEMKAKLEEVRKINKEKYYQLLRQASNVALSFTGSFFDYELKEKDKRQKRQNELEIDIEILVLKFKNADPAVQSKIKSELAALLSELFELKEAWKEEEVKRLEKRLQELKESLQARKQNKNEIVARRLQELLGDARYLKWE